MASEPKTTLLLTDPNTQVEFLNYVYPVKGTQCHSNHSPQLFEMKKKKNEKKTSHVI